MNVVRTIKTYFQRPVKERVLHAGFIIIVVISMIFLSIGIRGRKFEFLCFSDRNLRYAEKYKDMGVNLISSMPQRRNVDLSKHENRILQSGIDPYENECMHVTLPDGSNTYIICIHDPYTDLIVSGHLKVGYHPSIYPSACSSNNLCQHI
jgi:hypothetical protein